MHQQTVGSGDSDRNLSISIFVQGHETLMVVLREAQILERVNTTNQVVELNAMQNIPGLGLIKTRYGLISWSNPGAQRMLGYSGKQLQDAPFFNLFAQGVGELLMESCMPALMAGASYTERLTLLSRNAGTVTLDVSASNLSFENEEILWTLMAPTTSALATEAQACGPTGG
jgi:nitrogen-specific signal transduction histidine kinase